MQQIKLAIVKESLEEKKAYDIKIIDVEERSPFFSYFVICSVDNIPQANACIDQIKENFAKANIELKDHKGNRKTPWSILDLGDILVHIFLEEERKKVSLEDLLMKNEYEG